MPDTPTTPSTPGLEELAPIYKAAVADEMPHELRQPLIETLRREILACRPGDMANAYQLACLAFTMGGMTAIDQADHGGELTTAYLTGMAAVMQALGIDAVDIPADVNDAFAESFSFSTETLPSGTHVRYRLTIHPSSEPN